MDKFAELIRKNERFLITTHVAPDGDGLGSEMALLYYLQKVGKQATVLNTDPTPAKFQLVDPRGQIQVFQKGDSLPDVDMVLVADTSDWKMLGPLGDPIRALGVPVLFIDHHVPELPDVESHLVDESFSSTGELVYTFLRHLRADIDAEIALAVYVAIVTDTGSFRFKRTSPRCHTIAAEILQKGIQPEQVYQSLYARNPLGKMRLLGYVLESLEASSDGRLAWLVVPLAKRKHYGASVEDTEPFVDQLTLVDGVEIGLLFREDEGGIIKVSLRGTGQVPVIGIARKFGGGGHRHAAGMKVSGDLEAVKKAVLKEALSSLKSLP